MVDTRMSRMQIMTILRLAEPEEKPGAAMERPLGLSVDTLFESAALLTPYFQASATRAAQ